MRGPFLRVPMIGTIKFGVYGRFPKHPRWKPQILNPKECMCNTGVVSPCAVRKTVRSGDEFAGGLRTA